MKGFPEVLRDAKATGDLSAVVDAIPYLRFIGFSADGLSGN